MRFPRTYHHPVVIKTTGTPSFDSQTGDGRDTTANDSIVRSFDSFTEELTFSINAYNSVNTITGLTVVITGKLPATANGLTKAIWDKDAFPPNTEWNADFTEFTLKLGDQQTGTSRTIPMTVKVLGARNNLPLSPSYTINVEGNDASYAKSAESPPVRVTARPGLDLRVEPSALGIQRVTIDGTKGAIVPLTLKGIVINNDYGATSLKGIEYPTGPIRHNLNLSVTLLNSSTGYGQTQANNGRVRLIDFGLNGAATVNGKYNAKLNTSTSAPYGKMTFTEFPGRNDYVYDSGKLSVTQPYDGAALSITWDGYRINGVFPPKDANTTPIRYGGNEGVFLSGTVYVFVPNPGGTTSWYTYQIILDAAIANVAATTISGKIINSQTEHAYANTASTSYTYIPGGSVVNMSFFLNSGFTKYMDSHTGRGDGAASRGTELGVNHYVYRDKDSADGGGMIVGKFDPEGFEFVPMSDDAPVEMRSLKDVTKWKHEYGVGTWSSDDQQSKSKGGEPAWYATYAEAKASGKPICAIRATTTDPFPADQYFMDYRVKVRETAVIGKVYQVTTYACGYSDAYKTVFCEYPISEVFVKSSYGADGSFRQQNNEYIGDSILIVEDMVRITKVATNPKTDAQQSSFHLPSGANIIKWKLSPTLTIGADAQGKTDNVTITDTIPKGFKYIEGSVSLAPDSVTTNSDGTTKLVWTLKNVPVNSEIPPITYLTEIPMTTPNGTQFGGALRDGNGELTTPTDKDDRVIIKSDRDRSRETHRADNFVVTVITDASFFLVKNVYVGTVKPRTAFDYIMYYTNNTNNTYENIMFVDVLPRNNDNRRCVVNNTTYPSTQHLGTYTVSVKELPPDSTLEYTTNDTLAPGVDPQHSSVQSAVWLPMSLNTQYPAKAIRFKVPIVAAYEARQVRVYLTPEGNGGHCVYSNSFAGNGANAKPVYAMSSAPAAPSLVNSNAVGVQVAPDSHGYTVMYYRDSISDATKLGEKKVDAANGVPEGQQVTSDDVVRGTGDQNWIDAFLSSAGANYQNGTVEGGYPYIVADEANNIIRVLYKQAASPEADLEVSKSAAQTVKAGDLLTYTINVRNNGPNDATDVKLSDAAPKELTNVQYSTDNQSWSAWNSPLDMGTMTNGQSRAVYIRGTVDPATADGTVIPNTASVTTATKESNTANNTARVNTTVDADSDDTCAGERAMYNALTEVISSVAKEESAAASVIHAEANKLDSVIKKNPTPKQLMDVNNAINDMIDTINENNDQLVKKMELAVSVKPSEGCQPEEADKAARQEALNDVISSIAEEESAFADLMNKEAAKIRAVAQNPASSADDMIKINDNAAGVVKKISQTNGKLANKLDYAVNTRP